ncbi:MAG TPA: squalene/phytoene synthase family protein [Anaerolineae bacterium]|nr:squalene/phytoene synthase family protein [Anaerolineae bacterium]
MDLTATMARSITRASSVQTYYTVRLLVDRDLQDDCYRAYAYFRWADDIIDVAAQSDDDRISFISRQRDLIDRLYRNERPDGLSLEEQIIADLISHDRDNEETSGLRSFIYNFLAVIEFDAYRKGRSINQQELTWYSDCLGKAVTDCIQYFIGHGHPYPAADNQYVAASAAHITHMLRDMVPDVAEGFINIPRDYLEAHAIGAGDVDSPPFRTWVRSRVELARRYLREGKCYLDGLKVLRCKIAGYWYCARFEGVLDTIERDGYILRAEYNERRKRSTWLKMARLAVVITLRHIAS